MMRPAHCVLEVQKARAAIALIGRLSDNLIGFGPFGIGLDGFLAWIPGVGDLYSLGAGAALLLLGVRARAPQSALVGAAALVALRSGADLVPIAGPVVADLFRGHRMAARLLLKAIDETVYVDGAADPFNPNYAAVAEAIRSGRERRRIVFLG